MNRTKHCGLRPWLFALIMSLAGMPLHGAITPYTVDSATLHLWHFDDLTTPVVDFAPGGTNLTFLAGGATLGNPSFATNGVSFTNCISFGTIATASAVIFPSGTGNLGAVTSLTFAGGDGAFTYEAVVQVEFSPTNFVRNQPCQILNCDADNTGARVFQFRLDPVGFIGGGGDTNFVRIEFINGTTTVAMAPLPASGPDAIFSNAWYHVAVTYNGQPGTASNLLCYWTLLDTNRAAADCIFGTNMASSLPGVSNATTVLSIGNSARNPSGGNGPDTANFLGQIDEVRISSVARVADEMMFTNTSATATNLAILTQPSSVLANDADTVNFAVTADGPQPIFYQWYQNGSAIDGATNSDLTLILVDATNAGSYDVVVSNSQMSLTSAAVSLTLQGPVVTLWQVNDGNLPASGYGYAGDSDINGTAFICSGLMTLGNQQFFAYYGRHQTDPNYAFNDTIWIARRTVGSAAWQVFQTLFTPDDITDGHDVVAFGIDGNGVMHMSWGMHDQNLHYARSTGSVLGSQPIVFGPDLGSMTGIETSVTYPQFLSLPNGDLFFIYRIGASGGGDTWLNRWSVASQTWTNVNVANGVPGPFIKGNWSAATNYNAYPNMPCVDADGDMVVVWTWRETPAYESNHDLNYAESMDGGVTWQRFEAAPYDLPISKAGENGDTNSIAQIIVPIAQNYSLINQAGMCLDASNLPVVATWWAPGSGTGNFSRQYMVVFPDTNGIWQTRQISNRTNDPSGTMELDGAVRDLGRPVVVCDTQNRVIVLYRDNFGSNGLTVAYTLPYAMDPQRTNWTTIDLTTDNLGNYEPVIDLARWNRDNVLDIVYQASEGEGYTAPANTASPIGVLEWNAAAYFNFHPALQVALANSNQDVVLSWNSQPGWGYEVQWSANLISWNVASTLSGVSGFLPMQYVDTNGVSGSQRFWRLQTMQGGF